MTSTRLAIFVALATTAAHATAQPFAGGESTAVFSPVTWERLVNAADEPQNWLMYNGTLDSKRFSQLDLFRIVQGTHGACFNPPYHRRRDIRIVIPEQAGADAHNRHV